MERNLGTIIKVICGIW